MAEIRYIREDAKLMRSQSGLATLTITVILIIATLLMMAYTASYTIMQQRTTANQNNSTQSFAAAEAGLAYGFAYLTTNTSTVLASKVGNAISYSLASIPLSNNASYTVTYSSAVNNFTLITITATGTSSDGTSSHTLSQQAYLKANTITVSAIASGTISLVGGSTLSNLITNANIESGAAVTINNGADTITSTGVTSSQGNYGSDLQQNVASLASMNDATFFQYVFGQSESVVKTASQTAGTYYNNSVSGGDYSYTLQNQQGVTIWIDQSDVTLGHGVTIGTPLNPVTLIVNGNLTIANGVTLYGFVYVASMSGNNSLSVAGGAVLYGGIAASGNINISNGFKLYFAGVPITSTGGYTVAKVPGSWKDF